MAKAKTTAAKKPAAKKAAAKPAAKAPAKAAAPAKKVATPDKFTMTTMVAFVADKTGFSKKQAKDAVEAFIEVFTAGMIAGNRVPFGTVGKAYVRERPATKKRMGRNPKTGEQVVIPAKPSVRVPKFTYGKAFKEAPQGDLDKVTNPEKVKLDNKAKIFFRPYAAPPEQPDASYDLWFCTGRVLEHWHTGTMTRRVEELHRAYPAAQIWMHPKDAEARGVKRNDLVWIESRRGKIQALVETQGRNQMPRGYTFVPMSDEGVFVNKICLDVTCPQSKESDFKKAAVKVYKA